MLRVIFLVLMIGFVSAVEVDFDCPNEIYVGEEFECSVEVEDGDGVYDVKVDLDGERDSVLVFWDGEVWKSGYYYFKDFVEDGDEGILRLRVSEVGRFDGVLKLRQGDKREFFDVEIRVRKGARNSVPSKVGTGVPSSSGKVVDDVNISGDEEVIVLNEVGPEVIVLNSFDVEEEWDYVSKDGLIVDWLPYVFSLFLIFLVGILMWERF